jgi:hypothetical protein
MQGIRIELDLRNDDLIFRFCERGHESIKIRNAIGFYSYWSFCSRLWKWNHVYGYATLGNKLELFQS